MTQTSTFSLASRLSPLRPMTAAAFVLAIAAATIAGAWIFEWAGFPPCDLCLKQRWAYYAGVPLAAAALLLAATGTETRTRPFLALLAVIFVGSAVFGAYHAGVEWKFWEGPAGCTGAVAQQASSPDEFWRQLQTTKVVRCDEVELRVFGLSLAAWNAAISLLIAGIAAKGAFSDPAGVR